MSIIRSLSTAAASSGLHIVIRNNVLQTYSWRKLRAIVLQVLRLPLRLLMMGIRMPETF
jgi:hypothetical protein